MVSRTDRLRPAFNLVELIVVIAILALLAAITIAGVQSVRTTMARTDCQSRMRQLAVAAQNHYAAHGHFPPGVDYPFSTSARQTEINHAGLSWQSSLLPFVEQDALWRAAWSAHKEVPSGNSPAHDAVAGHSLTAFRCPIDGRPIGRFPPGVADEQPAWGLTNYLGVAGTDLHADDGVLHPNFKPSVGRITDGTSSTVMIGERPTGPDGYGNAWYSGWGTLRYFKGQLLPVDDEWANAPPDRGSCPRVTVFQSGRADDPCHQRHFWSLHPGGANFAFCDGSVKFLRYSAADILPALATRAGGEVVEAP